MLKSLFEILQKKTRRFLLRRRPLVKTPDISDHTFLFLGGLHRSGTSILHRLLREHPATSGFFNTGVPEDEGQHLQTVFPAAKVFGGPGLFAFYPNAHLCDDSPLVSSITRNQLLREWGAYYDMEKKLLLEKSPPNLVRSRFFQKLFPNSKFVFIVRHPVAVALATRKWSKTSPVELILHWYLAHRIMLNDAKFLDHSMIFRYEDFVSSSQFYLDRICEFAGINKFLPTESIINHNDRYMRSWIEDCQEDMHLLTDTFPAVTSFIGELGYSATEPFVSKLPSRDFLKVDDH